MSVFRVTRPAAFAVVGLIAIAASTSAFAHAVCGNRVFPATVNVDDPGVGDELSIPTANFTPSGYNSNGGHTNQYGWEWDKTITNNFGFILQSDYQTGTQAGVPFQGEDSLQFGLKYEYLCLPDSEFMSSIGVIRNFGTIASANLANTSWTQPTLYVGKGLGDLPIGFFRPFALTGEVAYQISDQPAQQSNAWNFGATLQCSIPHLQEHVKDLGLPKPLAHLLPVVEFQYQVPTDGSAATGTVSPGVLYEADTWQLGFEVNIPVNDATRQNQGVGYVAQLHFFLDDIFPNSIGKPIFGGKVE